MSMGVSYLRAKFQDDERAKIAEIVGRKVLDDLYMFHNRYQSIRHDTNISVKDRIKNLFNNFPLIKKYFDIPIVHDSDMLLNWMVGWNEVSKETPFNFYRKKNELYLFNEVWFYTGWDGICIFFEKLGAVETGWIGGEMDEDVNIDLFERIEMYSPHVY